MIAAEHAIDRLIESCPSFLGASDLYDYMEWSEEEGRPDAYVRAGAFAEHVLRLAESRDVDELPGVFTTVEHLLVEGDADTYDLVAIGMLEPLQNAVSHGALAVSPGQVRSLLGSAAAEAWDESETLWASASAHLHTGPRVTTEQLDDVDDPNLRLYFRLGRRRMADKTLVSASDVLQYEQWVADMTWRSPQARHRNNMRALLVGLVLALCVLIAMAIGR